MVYRVLPATPSDLPDIIAVYHAAFAADPFIGQLMLNVPPEVKQAHDMHWYGREFELSRLNGLQFRKVVDGDGCVRRPRRSRQLGRALTCGKKASSFCKMAVPVHFDGGAKGEKSAA